MIAVEMNSLLGNGIIRKKEFEYFLLPVHFSHVEDFAQCLVAITATIRKFF